VPWGKVVLGLVASAIATQILQTGVGNTVLYAHSTVMKQYLHQAIVTNQLPAGFTWESFGAQGCNVRILVVFLAEALHRLTGVEVLSIYGRIDSLCLFIFFPVFFLYLRHWLSESLSLIGVLYFALVNVMSYHFGYFHPWDRPSQLAWVCLLWLIRGDRLPWAVGVLVVAVTIKYDVLLLIVLYGAHVAWVKGQPRRGWAGAAGMAAAGLGVLMLVVLARPGGNHLQLRPGFGDGWVLFTKNLQVIWQKKGSFPPLLVFGIPVALGVGSLWKKPSFESLCVSLGLLMFIEFLLASQIQEVRAQMPLLLLFLPAALIRLEEILLPGGRVPSLMERVQDVTCVSSARTVSANGNSPSRRPWEPRERLR